MAGAAAFAAARAAAEAPSAEYAAPTILRAGPAPTLFVDALSPDPLAGPATFADAAALADFATTRAVMADAATTLRLYFVNGGGAAHVLNVAEDAVGSTLDAALATLGSVGDVDFVAAPYAARLPGDAAGSVYRALLKAARARRGVVLVDPPVAAKSGADIGRWVTALDVEDRDAAAFAPRLRIAGMQVAASTSGPVAGLIHSRGAKGGVWKSPSGAGAILAGVETWGETSAEAAAAISARNVNLVRVVAGRPALWGARTLAPENEWRYLPVRRLALQIERSLAGGLAWAAFEANDARLWSAARAAVADFLTGYWRDGALAGDRPDRAFFVRCNAGTTTAADVAAGVFRMLIGVAPLRAAEFVTFAVVAAAASD